MKKMLAMMCILVSLSFGCAQNGSNQLIVDGKLTAVGEASLQLAVGIALSSKPEIILPAYGVATALLAILSDSSTVSTIPGLQKAVDKELDKLHLDPLAKQSFNDLVVLVEAQIKQNIAKSGIEEEKEKIVIIKQMIQIVQNSAAARLEVSKQPQ